MRLLLTAFIGLLLSIGTTEGQEKKTIDHFSLHQMNSSPVGKIYRSDLQVGPVFVLEAYFEGCSYCNENATKVNALADLYKGNRRVQVIDLGNDTTDSDYERWISRHKPNHPVLKDADRVVLTQLGVEYYPTTFVVDCNMNVIYEAPAGVWTTGVVETLKSKINMGLNETICKL